jgi:type VI secretion system secreted protein Hcp
LAKPGFAFSKKRKEGNIMFKDKRTAMVGTLVVALFLSSLTLTNPGKALAVSAFLKIDVAPGESTDDKHKDWIEAMTWSFGETNSGTLATGGGAGAGKVTMQNFRVTKKMCKASPKLFLACARGDHIKDVSLEVCRSGGDKQTFLKVKLSEVIVSSFVNLGSSGSTDVYPTEEIVFNFGKIEISYTQMDSKTGKPMGDIKTLWDVISNKGN